MCQLRLLNEYDDDDDDTILVSLVDLFYAQNVVGPEESISELQIVTVSVKIQLTVHSEE